MSDFDPIFKDVYSRFDDFNRRLKKFETWEPPEGDFWVDVGAHQYRSTNFAMAPGWREIAFNAELWDTNFAMSGGQYTAPMDGKYLFITNLNWITFVGTFQLEIFDSPGIVTPIHGIFDGAKTHGSLSGIRDLSTGDRVRLRGNATLATSIVGTANGYYSFFQVQRVG